MSASSRERDGFGLPPGFALGPSSFAVGLSCLVAVACGSGSSPGDEALASTPRSDSSTLPEPVHALFDARLELPLQDHKRTGALAIDADGDGVEELVEVSVVPGGMYCWDRLRGGFDAERAPREIPLGAYGLGPVSFDRARPALVAAASQETRLVHLIDLSREEGEETLWIEALDATPTALAAGRLKGNERAVLAIVTEAEVIHLFDERGEATVHSLATRDGDTPTLLHFLESGAGLIVGLQGRRSLELYASDGSGSLRETPAHIIPLQGIPRDASEADLDGDGDRELLVVGGDHSVWIFGWGTPGGPLAGLEAGVGRITEWPTGAIPIGVETVDFDEDGDVEVCVLGHYDLKVHVFDDLHEEGPARRLAMECGQGPWGLAVGDFNGDGHADVATTNTDSYRSSLILGNGDGSFGLAHRVGCGRAPLALATGDLNGDGYPEALAISAIDQRLHVLRNVDGRLGESEPISSPSATDGLRCVDIDGDGHRDVAYLSATPRGGELVLLFNDGRGRLAVREGLEPVRYGLGVGDIWCDDLDGDGVNDLVVSDPEGGRIVLFEGQRGSAGYGLAERREFAVEGGPAVLNLLPAQGKRPPRLCVGLEGSGLDKGLTLLEIHVDEAGRVQLEHSRSLPSNRRTGEVVCADFDGDSFCDLALLGLGHGDVSPGEIFVWRSDSEGKLRYATTLKTGLAPFTIVAADLNGDGRIDLASNAMHSHHVSVWLSRDGEAAPSFLRLVDFGVGRGPLDLCATDMNLDGRIDLVVADNYNSSVSTLFNRSEQ